MIITEATLANGRPSQEDRHVVKVLPSGEILAAVFDGHGGSKAAEVCKQFVAELAIKQEHLYPHLLLKAVLEDLAYMCKDFEEGTTASVVYIDKDFNAAHVAIIGDSPVIIFDDSMKLHRSPEHNIRTNTIEEQAAINRGAYSNGNYVYNRHGGLQMSRALGDCKLDFLNHEPEIYTVNLAPYSFILIASDGLLDPSHSAGKDDYHYTGVIATIHGGGDASDLVNLAEGAHTGDNATAILIKKPFIAAFVSNEDNKEQYMFQDEFEKEDRWSGNTV